MERKLITSSFLLLHVLGVRLHGGRLIRGGRRRLIAVGRAGGQRDEGDGGEAAEDEVFHAPLKAMAVPDKKSGVLGVAGEVLEVLAGDFIVAPNRLIARIEISDVAIREPIASRTNSYCGPCSSSCSRRGPTFLSA